MTMGTNEESQTRTRSLTRSTKRDVLIYGLSGAVFALLFVMTIPNATTWYLILGTCILAIAAIVYVVKAIIALRQDEYATSSGNDDISGQRADVKVLDGATYTVVKRSSPAAGQRSHYWLGDNGQEIEMNHEEAARLS